jgi:hypothetical protein
MVGRQVNVSISIEPGLLRWLDNTRGDVSRSKYITRMLKTRRRAKVKPEIKGEE